MESQKTPAAFIDHSRPAQLFGLALGEVDAKLSGEARGIKGTADSLRLDINQTGAEARRAVPASAPEGHEYVCVLTRFELRHAIDLVRTYLDYRRVLKDAHARVGGEILHAAFAVESVRCCYSISVWRNEGAIADFGTNAPLHTAAAQRAFARLAKDPSGRQQLWSTRWTLTRASNNLEWRPSRGRRHQTR